MFDNARNKFNGALKALTDIFTGRTTKKEGKLSTDAYAVKRKLGKSFFTKRIGDRTRQRIINSLSLEEKVIASARGWLLLTDREFKAAVRTGLITLEA